jgi:hypothetical protein
MTAKKVGGVLAVATAAILLGAVPMTAAAEVPAAGLLSNERTLTRWAHPAQLVPVLTRPSAGAPAVARLHWQTEDGRPEVYVALRSRYDAQGRPWVLIRVPMRPNGVTGWVPRAALGALHVVTTRLVIDTRDLRATLTRAGRTIWTSVIGVGAPSTPTPVGRFYIRELLYVGHVDPFYGPWAFGTSAYSAKLTDWPGGGVVGIHGTDQPALLPGRPSHGCIRLPNAAVSSLARLMPIGTPVLIV